MEQNSDSLAPNMLIFPNIANFDNFQHLGSDSLDDKLS